MIKLTKRHLIAGFTTLLAMLVIISYQNCSRPVHFSTVTSSENITSANVEKFKFTYTPMNTGGIDCSTQYDNCASIWLSVDLGSGNVEINKNDGSSAPIFSGSLGKDQILDMRSALNDVQFSEATVDQFRSASGNCDPVSGLCTAPLTSFASTIDHEYSMKNGAVMRAWEPAWMSSAAAPDMSETQMVYTGGEIKMFCWLKDNLTVMASDTNAVDISPYLQNVLNLQWTDNTQANFLDCSNPGGDTGSCCTGNPPAGVDCTQVDCAPPVNPQLQIQSIKKAGATL